MRKSPVPSLTHYVRKTRGMGQRRKEEGPLCGTRRKKFTARR